MTRGSRYLAAVTAVCALLLAVTPAALAAHDVNAGSAPTVVVSAQPTQATPGQDIAFLADVTDADPADSHLYEWQFGAGAAFEQAPNDPVHAFAQPGTYVVTARITDQQGHQVSAQVSVVVAYPPPSAAFTATSVAPTAATLIGFDASASAPAAGVTIVRYDWDLNGNGTFDTTCTGPVSGASFGSSGTKTVTLKVTDSSGGSTTTTRSITVAPGTGGLKTAAKALKPTVSGCAGTGGSGVVVPGGPIAVDCFTTVHTGIAELMSVCFRREVETVSVGAGRFVKVFDNEVYRSDARVRLNGIDIKPSSGVKLRIDTFDQRVRTEGGSNKATASLNSGTSLGSLTFIAGKPIDWNLPAGTKGRFTVATVSVTKGASLLGLDVEGDARLDLVYRGAELPIWMHLPKPIDISGQVTLKTDNMTGLRVDDVHIRVANATFGAFEIRELDVKYKVPDARFDGFADLYLSSVGQLDVRVQITGTAITMFAANFTPVPPLNLGSGVFMQHINFAYNAGPPLTLMGGVKLTAGPPIKGSSAAAIEGSLKYVASSPWLLRADGNASLVGVGLATAYIEYRSNGMFRMGGEASATFYDIVSGYGRVGFWLYTPTGQFNAEGDVKVCVWKGCGGGGLVISNVGIGGCIYTWVADFGMGYHWGGAIKFFLTGCDIGHWRSAWDGGDIESRTSVGRAAARASEDITIAAGERAAFIRVAGVDVPPRVRVTGPDGTVIETPEGTENYVKTDKYVILQVPPHKATYVMVAKPAGGRWRVETIDGSSTIAGIHGAEALPEPVVTAKVTGTGHSRRLQYVVKPEPGQVVRFIERAGDMSRVLGTATGASGNIAFTPGDGRKGRRAIVAMVEQDGMPRANVDVTTYAAPGPLVPMRPAKLKVTRSSFGAVVNWGTARRAARYRVVVTVSDGRRLVFVQRTRRLKVTGVVRTKVVKVAVAGLRSDGVSGPAAKLVSGPPRSRRAR